MELGPEVQCLLEIGDWFATKRCRERLLGDDPALYDAALIRDVLLRHLGHVSRNCVKRMTISLRMYLRFLASSGSCAPGLAGAIPTVPEWSLSALPRYIPVEDIERAIASCDTTMHKGLRDRAILLLLARLALRAGDVLNLLLTDIDWDNARLRVCGNELRCPREYEAQVFEYFFAWSMTVDFEAVTCPAKVIGSDPTVRNSFMPSMDLSVLVALDYDFLPETSHLLQLEEPEECAARTLDFLEQHNPSQ